MKVFEGGEVFFVLKIFQTFSEVLHGERKGSCGDSIFIVLGSSKEALEFHDALEVKFSFITFAGSQEGDELLDLCLELYKIIRDFGSVKKFELSKGHDGAFSSV